MYIYILTQMGNKLYSIAVAWREHEGGDENLVIELPIKKRINTELFIESRATLYIVNGDFDFWRFIL